MVKEHFII